MGKLQHGRILSARFRVGSWERDSRCCGKGSNKGRLKFGRTACVAFVSNILLWPPGRRHSVSGASPELLSLASPAVASMGIGSRTFGRGMPTSGLLGRKTSRTKSVATENTTKCPQFR